MAKETLALRHVPFEDLGIIAPILERRGHRVGYLDIPSAVLSRFDSLAPDLLVILGGPIGAYAVDDFPFLSSETACVRRRLEADRPTLGICLGAQLMARALGARVHPGPGKEIGWAPITLTEAGVDSCLRHLADLPVLHWHGDTFQLPEGAVRLASTAICENQAFRWGGKALALQFHAEAAGAALESWFVGHSAEIAATPGVDIPRLRSDTKAYSAGVVAAGTRCFEAWLSSVGL